VHDEKFESTTSRRSKRQRKDRDDDNDDDDDGFTSAPEATVDLLVPHLQGGKMKKKYKELFDKYDKLEAEINQKETLLRRCLEILDRQAKEIAQLRVQVNELQAKVSQTSPTPGKASPHMEEERLKTVNKRLMKELGLYKDEIKELKEKLEDAEGRQLPATEAPVATTAKTALLAPLVPQRDDVALPMECAGRAVVAKYGRERC
jgi:DNA repair exonuclease SbcCD ATPase subunit